MSNIAFVGKQESLRQIKLSSPTDCLPQSSALIQFFNTHHQIFFSFENLAVFLSKNHIVAHFETQSIVIEKMEKQNPTLQCAMSIVDF